MLLLIIPSFMMTEALQKSVFQCLQVFLLSYVFLKSMNVVGHNDPEWFSLTELSSGNNTRRKISHRKVLTRKNINWLHVFLHFFTPFRWPWNSLKCVFMFYCNEWKSSAKLSSHSWAGWYPRLLQTVSETRQCECSEAIMSVVQFVVSTHRIKSWAWPLWREIFTLTFQNENCISWLQKQKWQIKSNVHSRTWRGSALHQLFSKIEKKKKKNCCRCKCGNIFTFVRERYNPVWKKIIHSNWQQGVHKTWIKCGVWEKRVKYTRAASRVIFLPAGKRV